MAERYVANVGDWGTISELVRVFIQTKQYQNDSQKTAIEGAIDVVKSDITSAHAVRKELADLESGVECFNPF